ncbi:hypothetical protein [uncultured Neptuniibacter sp.]|uniref:hypothetical protein n=1 Tax=uncultured Neptuniibacter sp. TaxID=502143 RepID=UPI00261C6317|nr:hypothetical protein [uncultured Neptuniibacter sp.]
MLWNEISVGDCVMLDADLYESNTFKLHKYQPYEVLAKVHCMAPEPSRLIVESDITGEFINLHPALLCSYQSSPHPVSHS